MGTVWVIEQGSYSDYRVVGVYTSKANAEKIAALLNKEKYSDEATVAEWPVNPAVDEINQGLKMYLVQMHMNGNTERVEESDITSYSLSSRLEVWERTKAPAWQRQPIDDMISGHVWAESVEHAVKIANEYRARAIADGRMKERK